MIRAEQIWEVALLAEGVDRNQVGVDFCLLVDGSPSSQRAWIEINLSMRMSVSGLVALLAEGVDRNCMASVRGVGSRVALLAEGVDRNLNGCIAALTVSGRPPRRGRG